MISSNTRKAELVGIEAKIYKFLKESTIEEGYQPSLNEIAQEIGSNRQRVRAILRRIEAKGWIAGVDEGRHRAIVIPELKMVLGTVLG